VGIILTLTLLCSHKDGYVAFSKWKRVWATNGKTEANIRTYMVDQMLPFWLRCSRCGKWRQLSRNADITPEFIGRFQCGTTTKGVKVGSIEGSLCV